jgi:hypothetical protein
VSTSSSSIEDARMMGAMLLIHRPDSAFAASPSLSQRLDPVARGAAESGELRAYRDAPYFCLSPPIHRPVGPPKEIVGPIPSAGLIRICRGPEGGLDAVHGSKGAEGALASVTATAGAVLNRSRKRAGCYKRPDRARLIKRCPSHRNLQAYTPSIGVRRP